MAHMTSYLSQPKAKQQIRSDGGLGSWLYLWFKRFKKKTSRLSL